MGFQSTLYQPANTAVSSQGGGGGEQGGEGGKRESEKGRESCPPQALSTQCNLPPGLVPLSQSLTSFHACYTGYLFSLLGTSSRETCHVYSSEQ